MNILTILTEVWTFTSVTPAIVGGLAFGVVIGLAANNPFFASRIATPGLYAVLLVAFKITSGVIFYTGQILDAYLSGDPNWTRVVSRFGLWLIFSFSIGVSVFITMYILKTQRQERRHHWRRRSHDHQES